jgi:putative transposase
VQAHHESSRQSWSAGHFRVQLAKLRLNQTEAARQSAYRQLFKARIAERALADIREATNKAWVLGNGQFKRKAEEQLKRPAARARPRRGP